MSVFNLYFKIAISQWRSLIIYAAIFISVFIGFGLFASNSFEMKQYKQVKPSIVVVDEDKTDASKAVVEFLSSIATIEDIEDNEAAQKDALFYRAAEVIVKIPKNFEQTFNKGSEGVLQIEQRSGSSNSYMIQRDINSFLQTIASYQKSDSSISFQQAAAYEKEDSEKLSKVNFEEGKKISTQDLLSGMYFNYMTYIILAMTILVVGLTMHIIYRSEVKKRNLISPLSTTKMNSQLIFANISFGFGLWLVFTLVITIMCADVIFSLKGLLFLINSFLFMLVCVCMAFFFSTVFANMRNADEAMNGVANVVGLGSSFLGGAFVPQMFIPASILVISRFTPTYWCVKLNDILRDATTITNDIVSSAAVSYGVLLLFAAVFLFMGLTLMKYQRIQTSITDNSDLH